MQGRAHGRTRAGRCRAGANVGTPIAQPPRMTRTADLLRPPLFLLLAIVSLPALSDEPDVDKARRQLESIAASLERYEHDAEMAQARETVLAIQAEAQALIDSRAPELQSLDARLAELGEASEGQDEAR